MAGSTAPIKFDVCIYKRDDISEEDFIHWATKVYPAKAKQLIKKHGVLKWAQTIQPKAARDPLRNILKTGMERPEWTVPDYDLTTTYWLPSLDHMQTLTSDPEWLELEKEALEKANMSIGHFVYGHEIVHFENNHSSVEAA